jgi:serine/threonine-protein kinase
MRMDGRYEDGTAPAVCVGEVLAGKYRVERVLGVGGMGVVVAAHNIALDSPVAIKLLLPELARNGEAIARFLREARAAAKIGCEYVGRVHDVATFPSGAPYIVMEYLDGEDLAAIVRRGPLGVEQAVDFVLQVCVALAEAHGLGIIHRDLKPANLFCVRRSDGRELIKVLDFGISKFTEGPGGSKAAIAGFVTTRATAVMGSPLYMSPEQLRSARSVDSRTDIWSLGVILFQLVSGRVPFSADSLGELAIQIATDEPASVRAYRPDLPKALEGVILKCLRKDREKRYAGVADLARALSPLAPRSQSLVERVCATAGGTTARVAADGSPPSSTLSATGSQAPWSAPLSPGGRRRTPAAVVAVIGIAMVAAIVALVRSHASLSRGAAETTIPAEAAVPATATTAAGSDDRYAVEPDGDPSVRSTTDSGIVVSHSPAAVSRPTSLVVRPERAPIAAAALAPAASSAPTASAASTSPRGAVPKLDCDPPYRLDELGQKHFIPECFR